MQLHHIDCVHQCPKPLPKFDDTVLSQSWPILFALLIWQCVFWANIVGSCIVFVLINIYMGKVYLYAPYRIPRNLMKVIATKLVANHQTVRLSQQVHIFYIATMMRISYRSMEYTCWCRISRVYSLHFVVILYAFHRNRNRITLAHN